MDIVDVPANVEIVAIQTDQNCRSAPYTSVGGVPRNFELPESSSMPSSLSENNTIPIEEKTTSKKKRNQNVCAMAECPNPADESYYTFPNPEKQKTAADKKKQSIREKEWVVRCKRGEDNKLNPRTARICGRHFSAKCFKPGGQRKILKDDAVPDLDLPSNRPSSAENFKKTSTTVRLVREEATTNSALPIPSPSTTVPVKACKNTNTVCAVEICNSPNNVKYFLFPKNPELFEEWKKAIGRERLPKNPRICEQHFPPEMIERDLKSELMGTTPVKKLKPDAIPKWGILRSVPLTPPKVMEVEEHPVITDVNPIDLPMEEIVPRDQRAKKRKAISSALERIAAPEIVKTKEEYAQTPRNTVLEIQQAAEIKKLKKKLRESTQSLGTLKKENKRLQSKKHLKTQFRNHLATLPKLGPAQISCLVNKTKHARNTAIDIAKAAIFFSMSQRAYEHQRQTSGFYLPSQSQITKWFSEFRATPGFLEPAIHLLKQKLKILKEKQPLFKFSVIMFDEVAIAQDSVQMDQKTQTVRGPNSKFQVVLMRGLASK